MAPQAALCRTVWCQVKLRRRLRELECPSYEPRLHRRRVRRAAVITGRQVVGFEAGQRFQKTRVVGFDFGESVWREFDHLGRIISVCRCRATPDSVINQLSNPFPRC